VAIMTVPKRLRLVATALLSVAFITYVGICVWLKLNEHKVVFARDWPPVPVRESLGLQPETVQIGNLRDVPLFAWSIRSLPEDFAANVWLLYFHGSGENVTSHQREFYRLRNLGFNVLAPEYPGYAGKPGQPSEQAVPKHRLNRRAPTRLRESSSPRRSSTTVVGTSRCTSPRVRPRQSCSPVTVS